MVVDLAYGSDRVCGYVVGTELDGAPGIDEPAVCVVDGLDSAASEDWSREEDGRGAGERLDVAAGIT